MREILFRGKRIYDGEWAYGSYSYHDRLNRGFIVNVGVDSRSPIAWTIEVDPTTVGQFTGLYDSTKWEQLTEREREQFVRKGGMPSEWKGKKIFEGNIIRMHGNPEDIAVVQFGEFGCVDTELEAKVDHVHGWHYKPLETDGLSRLEPFCWEFQLNEMWIKENGVEVIGNIHDNPELLKGANDAIL